MYPQLEILQEMDSRISRSEKQIRDLKEEQFELIRNYMPKLKGHICELENAENQTEEHNADLYGYAKRLTGLFDVFFEVFGSMV